MMQTTPTYKYLVAEDESLIRHNLIKKINTLDLPLTLVGEAFNGMEAHLLIEKWHPDIVITDIRMPQYDGIELVRFLHKNHPSIKTIVLSGHNDFSYAQSAIHYDVKDYLLKPVTLSALSKALQKVMISLHTRSQELAHFRINTGKLDPENISELLEEYLHQHFREDISFAQVSECFGFTQEYLGKLLKKYTGETPSKYLAHLRINEAKRLLLSNPELEIHKVGELAGYRDGFYFSRAFKSYVGVGPSEFRGGK
jgi:YesN/AraC family two-component response regulator